MKKVFSPVSKIIVITLLLLVSFGVDTKTISAAIKPMPVEVSGWIPYWRMATGTADALAHIDVLKEISPFGYKVQDDGTLVDQMHIEKEPWQTLIKTAHNKKVKVLPTVIWNNGDAIDAILRNKKTRDNHIKEIVRVVFDNGFDGIDINYEGKKAETKKYFSLFLRDLYKAMGKKLVACSIEARTPLDARFVKIPKNIEYANDFVAINNYCDRVRIMAYDQGSIDLKLNSLVKEPYLPIADPKWVEKVIKLAEKTIAKKKIVIGVATYGYEIEVATSSSGYAYNLQWTFNPRYGSDLAQQLGITPGRNRAGELSFIYTPTSTSAVPQAGTESVAQSNNPLSSLATTTTAISATSSTPAMVTKPFRLVWWSDAQAIKDKIKLAQKLGVRGIAIFKIDGGEDSAIWSVLR